jgi:hypothetical protein
LLIIEHITDTAISNDPTKCGSLIASNIHNILIQICNGNENIRDQSIGKVTSDKELVNGIYIKLLNRYQLNSPGHIPSKLIQKLFLDQTSSDVTIFCDNNETVFAHKCILTVSDASDYFSRMFNTSMSEGNTKTVHFPTVAKKTMHEFLRYQYLGMISPGSDNDVLNMLELKSLADMTMSTELSKLLNFVN